jgi:hypothetical protein
VSSFIGEVSEDLSVYLESLSVGSLLLFLEEDDDDFLYIEVILSSLRIRYNTRQTRIERSVNVAGLSLV